MDRVTLHSSWRGIATTYGGSGALLVLGVIFVVSSGANVLPVLLLVAGAAFLVIALVDYPIAATFTAEGVERRAVLRRQTFTWDRVRELGRLRPRRAGPWRPPAIGGLLAIVGRRRFLLVDQLESAAEFDAVMGVIGDETAARLTGESLTRPPDETTPTWLYRRSRWKPESTIRR